MKKKSDPQHSALRQKAEKFVTENLLIPTSGISEGKAMKLIHELEVHQIELRLQNEELLLAKEQFEIASEKYSELYDFAPTGYFTLSKQGEILELNLAGAQMLGKNRIDLKNRIFERFIAHDSKSVFTRFLGEVFTQKTRQNCKVTLSTSGSTPVYFHLAGVIHDNGECCFLTATDISWRQQAEEEIRASNEFNDLLIQTIPFGIHIVDENGNVLYLNDNFQNYSSQEALGKKCWELYRDDKTKCTGCPLDTDIVIGETKSNITPGIFGGRTFEISHTGMIFKGRKALLEFFIDITEQSIAKNALKESEEKYRMLSGNFAGGVSLFENKKVKYISEGYLKILGYEKHEIENITFESIFSFIHDDDKKRIIDTIETAHLNQTKEMLYSFRIRNKQGEYIWMEDSVHLDYDDSGNHIRSIIHSKDITERKKAEIELQESESKYRAIFNNVQDVFYQTDLSGEVIEISPSISRLSGFSRDEIIGNPVFVLYYNPGDRDILLAKLMSEGELRDYEVKLKTKTGELRYVSLNASLICNSNGKPHHIDGALRDITERKLAEQAVIKSEYEFRLLAEAMPQIVWITRPDGWNIFFNQQWVDYTGLSLEESYGHGWNKPFHPDDQQRAWDAWQKATNNMAPYSLECRLRRFDGEYKWWLIRGIPILDENGTVLKWFGTCTDIDEMKHTEAELRERKTQYQNLANSGLALIWTSGTDKLCNYFNEPWLKFTGRTLEQELGNGWVEGVHPDDLDICIATYISAFDKHEPFEMEYRVRHASGEYRWILDLGSPNYNSAGEFIGYIGNCFDITVRKQAEKEISKLNEELEQRVSERTSQLLAANIELEKFSYTASHDLRTPLRALNGYASLLIEDYASSLNADGLRMLHVIQENAVKMGHLIDDLMMYSKIGHTSMNMSKIDMFGLAATTYNSNTDDLEKANIDFRLQNIPTAYGDASLMQQVFANLICNAVKYTSKKPVRVIEISHKYEGNESIYIVKDNGAGFDMEFYPKMFGVFQRLHSVREFEGSGIGLAIVQRIIKSHNGRVWAEGKVSEGASFYFALPINPE